MIKRQRGRGRNPGQKPQNNNPNRAYESNGPDLKVRGSAQTVFEKYQQLGRDSQSNGDRVLGENYMQHAEHYFRVLRAMQPTFVPRSELMIAGYDDEEYEGDENAVLGDAGDTESGERQNGAPQPEFQQNRAPRDNRERDNRDRDNRDRDNRDRDVRDNNRASPQREFRDNREPREPRDPNEPRTENDEGRYGRRRRRPDRFGNENGAPIQGEGDQGQRSEGRPDNRPEGRPEGRYEGRRDPRPEYRGEGQVPQSTQPEAPISFAEPEFAQPQFTEAAGFSNPQEIIVATDAAPARERRPRPPRAAPRAPRSVAPKAEETGFGDEMPAFLSAPVPVVSND
jgi:Domain of unknown function (DUF4167)